MIHPTIEFVRMYQREGQWYGLLRLTLGDETRPAEMLLSEPGRIGFARVIALRPFDSMPGAPHRYFFARSALRLAGDDTELSVRVEVGTDAKNFQVNVPLELASHLIRIVQAKTWMDVPGLVLGAAS